MYHDPHNVRPAGAQALWRSAAVWAALILCLYTSPGLCRDIVAIQIADPITPVISEFIQRSITQAEKASAECIIIELDTPGGLDSAMRDIVKKILSSEVPIVVYVTPSGARAASAGAIITLAAHIAAMTPGTNIGAAHPVSIGMGQPDKEMASKIENDAAAYAESIAEKRGRNKQWAARAVRESISSSETEALSQKVINLVAADLPSLIAAIDGWEVDTASGRKKLATKDAAVKKIDMGIRETILKAIADPTVAYILLLIGLAGLYFEFSTPGAILPGTIGGIALILAFYSLQTLSANYAGLLLILLGVILFIAEIKITSYGLLSMGGIAAVVLGSVLLFDPSVPYLHISWPVIITSSLLVWAFFVVVIGLVVKAQRRRPQTGMEGLIGLTCEASTDVDGHGGKVFVHGEYWNARSDIPIAKGGKAQIISARGFELQVQPLKNNSL